MYPEVNPQPQSESNTKKRVLIIIGVVLLLTLCCCAGYFGLMYFGLSAVSDEATDVQTSLLVPLCQNHRNLSEDGMSIYFTDDYSTSLEETKEILGKAFYEGYDCNEIYTDGIMDMITKGQGFEVEATTSGTYAYSTITTSENVFLDLTLVQDQDSEWKISSISYTAF